jgi:hypothetical protein
MPTYTTANSVAALLQTADFTTSSTPTTSEVEDFIDQAEGEIERRTNRAWRTITVTREYQSFYPHGIYMLNFPPRVNLDHPNVVSFDDGTLDALEVRYREATWTDWLTTGTHTEDIDYWVDYTTGTIYFLRQYPLIWRPRQVRITYRYGTGIAADFSNQDSWVRALCEKMVAIKIMARFQEVSGGGQGGPGIMPNDAVIRGWKEEIDEKLDEETWLTRSKRPMVT